MITDYDVSGLIQRTCFYLDKENFAEFSNLCSNDFKYRILTYSDELLRQMTWIDLNKEEMDNLFKTLPQHVRLPGKFFRHASVQMIVRDEDGKTADAITSVMITHTDLDGKSTLYCSGRYRDVVSMEPSGLKLKARDVDLETRQLGAGPHVLM